MVKQIPIFTNEHFCFYWWLIIVMPASYVGKKVFKKLLFDFVRESNTSFTQFVREEVRGCPGINSRESRLIDVDEISQLLQGIKSKNSRSTWCNFLAKLINCYLVTWNGLSKIFAKVLYLRECTWILQWYWFIAEQSVGQSVQFQK